MTDEELMSSTDEELEEDQVAPPAEDSETEDSPPPDVTVAELLESAEDEPPVEEEEEPLPVTPEVPAGDYEYPDIDTEFAANAVQRSSLINRILNDVRKGEPDLPPNVLEHFETELIHGVINPANGKRVVLSNQQLAEMAKSRSVVTQASGIVRQMQLNGQIKEKKAPPPPQERAPKPTVSDDPPERQLSPAGNKLAERIAQANNLDKGVFTR